MYKKWVLDKEAVGRVDIVVYLGDGDGFEMCGEYARNGAAAVIALDNYAARVAAPRVTAKAPSGVIWIDRVSAKCPETWSAALRLAARRLA